jgi:hypothetical protein
VIPRQLECWCAFRQRKGSKRFLPEPAPRSGTRIALAKAERAEGDDDHAAVWWLGDVVDVDEVVAVERGFDCLEVPDTWVMPA